MRYFPFLRGKQHEMMALRDVATSIADNGHVVPILETVNANSTTQISLDRFIEASMPFLFICNPRHGQFVGDVDGLINKVVNPVLVDYDNWIPTLHISEETTLEEWETLIEIYGGYELALIYYGRPQSSVRSRIEETAISHHVFVNHRVENSYIETIPVNNRVLMVDSFQRQQRNADYPDQEFFTDLNTLDGNSSDVAFGDFSIVGDHYTETGGPPYAVVIHHIHLTDDSHSLSIHHFKSDRVDTPLDTSGKIIEATNNLVASLNNLHPDDTDACNEYRSMSRDQISRGLGYLKRLAIKHHLEMMLRDGILQQQH